MSTLCVDELLFCRAAFMSTVIPVGFRRCYGRTKVGLSKLPALLLKTPPPQEIKYDDTYTCLLSTVFPSTRTLV